MLNIISMQQEVALRTKNSLKIQVNVKSLNSIQYINSNSCPNTYFITQIKLMIISNNFQTLIKLLYQTISQPHKPINIRLYKIYTLLLGNKTTIVCTVHRYLHNMKFIITIYTQHQPINQNVWKGSKQC